MLASGTRLNVDGASIDAILLRMCVTGSSVVDFNWRFAGSSGRKAQETLRIPVYVQNDMVLYRLPVGNLESWRNGTIDQFFFTTDTPALVKVDSLLLLNRRLPFCKDIAGIVQYPLGNQIRPVLYTHCNSRLTYKTKVPKRAAFSAGLGVVEGGRPIAFTLVSSQLSSVG